MGNTLVIGDIHGCFDELRDLMDKAGLVTGDEIIAIGDVVDRGPDSRGVLAFFGETPGARSLMGNHERKHIRALRGEVRPALSQLIVRRQFGEGYEAACALMETFPRAIELPEALLVHGFFEPGVALAEQKDNVLIGTMTGQRIVGKIAGDVPWYTLYDGDKPLVVGHHDYMGNGEPLIHGDRVFGLDTGCCHGGRLTGLLLPAFEIVSVASRGNHWSAQMAMNADLRYTRTPIEALSWEAAEQLVARAERAGTVPEAARGRVDEIRALLENAEVGLVRLHEHLHARSRALVEALEAEHGALDDRQQGRLFAAKLGQTPVNALFHQARRGELTMEQLRGRYERPSQLVALVQEMGLIG